MIPPELQLVLDIVFAEGGTGLLWISIGTIVAVLLSLGLLVAFGIWAERRKWPQDDGWGTWGRRIFLVWCLVVLPSGSAFVGFTWGALTAVKRTIDSQELISKSVQHSLDPILAHLYLMSGKPWEEKDTWTEELHQEALEFVEQGKKVDIAGLQRAFDELLTKARDEVIADIKEDYIPKGDDLVSKTSRFVLDIILRWMVGSKVGELHKKAQEAVDELKANLPGDVDKVECREISHAISKVHVQPYFDEEYKKFKNSMTLLSSLQILASVGVPWIVLHFVGVYSRQSGRGT